MQIKLFNSDLVLLLPKGYEEVDNGYELYDEMYHLRKASDIRMFQNVASESYGNIVISHIAPEDALPFGNERELIKEIHDTLADNQGLIEVESGTNPRGYKYIYSIIKTYHRDLLNVNYCLRMNIKNGSEIIEVNASFFEARMTGLRSAMAMNMAMSLGFEREKDNPWVKGWAEDPYDPEFDKGCPMIMAERRGLDGLFPGDPLSQARELVLALTKDSYYKTRDEIEAESAETKKDKKEDADKQTIKEEKTKEEKDKENKEFGEKLFGKDTLRAGEYKVDIIDDSNEKKVIKISIPNTKDIKKLAEKAAGGVKSAAAKTVAELDKVKTPFEVPEDFRCKLNQPMPKELPGWGKREYIGFGKGTFAMSGIIMSWPVTQEESLPFDTEETIKRYHEDIGDNVGLISVKSGLTPKGNRYVYAIRKMYILDDEGNQKGPIDYELNLNIRINGRIHFMNGSFQATEELQGIRDALSTLTYGSRELKLDVDKWTKDPYDPDFKEGALMNWQEDEKYDGLFPYHPLSELRRFVKYVVENN